LGEKILGLNDEDIEDDEEVIEDKDGFDVDRLC
jgi:hypothetical protein